ncbi:MAG TPA: DUF3137 domain-containing protein [Allosphingosinicella sp.]|jgi:hypothetical protein|nr:DUF3137 domain-containing protein [Allosphingosinicella sp.]
MIQLTDEDFRTLCSGGTVRERLGALEGERKAAVRQFWVRGTIGLVLAAAALATLLNAGWEVGAFLVFAAFLVGTFVAAAAPLMAAKEGLKHPVLDEVAKKARLEYIPGDFTPPALASACALLFGGGGFCSETYSDLFNGTDEEGRGFAVYEANLQRRAGKNTYTVFCGQIYAIQRRPGRPGEIAIVPDRKFLNFWKPSSDMERVRIEGDEAFERKFEVYATQPMEARELLFDSAFRARLLELRKSGRVFVYVGPEEALVAATGKDRFEPGSMLRSRPGEERVKLMFDDVCASLALLGELKAKLG